MKKGYLMIAALGMFLASCGGSDKPAEQPTSDAPAAQTETVPAPEQPAASEPAATTETSGAGADARIAKGKEVYTKTCMACHQESGAGLPNAFPPLAGSDFLNADVNRAIGVVLHGKTGEITVNGNKFNSAMPAQTLNDDEVASVLSYVYASWGNKKQDITPEMVAAIRK